MIEGEEFKLYDCWRLQASILPRQCDINRQRGLFQCQTCKGVLLIGAKPKVTHISIGDPAATTREESGMAKDCSVPGCERQAQGGKDGMCCIHWREATGTPKKVKGGDVLGKAGLRQQSLPAKAEAPSAPTPPPITEYSALRSSGLLDRIAAQSVQPVGFFLDFTGSETLLEEIGPVCPELNKEIIELLDAVISGRLAWRQ